MFLKYYSKFNANKHFSRINVKLTQEFKPSENVPGDEDQLFNLTVCPDFNEGDLTFFPVFGNLSVYMYIHLSICIVNSQN